MVEGARNILMNSRNFSFFKKKKDLDVLFQNQSHQFLEELDIVNLSMQKQKQ